MFPSSYNHEIVRSYCQWYKWCPCKRSRSVIKGQGHRGQNPTYAFPDRNPSLISCMMIKWCSELDVAKERSPIVFQGHPLHFKVTRLKKNHNFLPKLGVSGLQLQFEFTNGYGMMHKVWSDIEEGPYCFSRSSFKFQGNTRKKHRFWSKAFPDHKLNFLMTMKWCTKSEVRKKRFPIVFRGHPSNCKVTWVKKEDCDPNCAFPGCESSLHSPMALKWCTKLVVV